MVKRQSPDRRPSKDEKKKLNLKKDPIAGEGNKHAKPPESSAALTTRPVIKNQPALESWADNELFPIVGIGASAGGLEAFTKLLKHLPNDTDMAFVLVQHLDPTHPSALTELLSRATAMPVTEVRDGMRIEPNHVYVIPPNTNMAILHHRLS